MIRFFDIILSLIAIILLSPILIPVMVILKFTGEHEIFFAQNRVGKNKKVFKALKFTTMLKDSENLPGGLITLENDPRILPFGNFLRKTKINELPQLCNILIGQMSVVGYRPFAVKHYGLYSIEIQDKISQIVPGLSGVGSIIFRNEEEILHSVENPDYVHYSVITPYKGQLESWYVDNRSLKNYFLIIFITIWVVLFPNSLIWQKVFKDLPPMPEEIKTLLKGIN